MEAQNANRSLVLVSQVSSERLKKLRVAELECERRKAEIMKLREDRTLLEQSVRDSSRMMYSTMKLMGKYHVARMQPLTHRTTCTLTD